MAYTVTKSTSWFSRLGDAFSGILFGIIMIIGGTILLWWNEGDFVRTGDALREAQAVTQELGDISKLDASKNGQVIHASGPAETGDMLSDPIFGISINALRLERSVEFYQWIERSKSETKQKLGGGEETVTTYTYVKEWTSQPVNSANFTDPEAREKNMNVVLYRIGSLYTQATNVTFGAYRLPELFINSIGGAVPLNVALSQETIAKLNNDLALAVRDARPEPQTEAGAEAQMVHVSGATVLLSKSPFSPQIGDVRITFRETRPSTVSILAKLVGNTFEQYYASNGKVVSRLAMGAISLENMYDAAHSDNAVMTWVLRIAGTFLVIFGLKLVLAPLKVLAAVIPLLGTIVGVGTGIVSTLLGLAWSLVIIAIAWLRFRPLIGCFMLAVAGGLIAWLYARGRARKAATEQAPAS